MRSHRYGRSCRHPDEIANTNTVRFANCPDNSSTNRLAVTTAKCDTFRRSHRNANC